MGSETYYALKKLLSEKGLSTAVGDEGGFAPRLDGEREAIELILSAIKNAGYKPGEDISIALDVAASEWYNKSNTGNYYLPKTKVSYTSMQLSELLCELLSAYPIVSIEDGMGEDDIEGWKLLTGAVKERNTLLVGDDLFVTNRERVEMGICESIANSVLIKPNQIGTLSEVMDTVEYAKSHSYRTIMSHRSGETEDTTIADLSVALRTEFIKTGAPARSERVAKYNRLTAIENELFSSNLSSELLW
jgi:enolase